MRVNPILTHVLLFLIGILVGLYIYNYQLISETKLVRDNTHFERVSVDSSRMKQPPVQTPVIKIKEKLRVLTPPLVQYATVPDSTPSLNAIATLTASHIAPDQDSIFDFEGCYNDSNVTITVKGFVKNGHVDSLSFTYQLNARVYTYTNTTIDSVFLPPSPKQLFILGGTGIDQIQKSVSCGLLRVQGKLGYGFLVTPFLRDYRLLFSLRLN